MKVLMSGRWSLRGKMSRETSHFSLRPTAGIGILFAVCALLLLVKSSSAQDIQTVVFPALKALYKSTNGDSWNNNPGWDTTRVPTATELATWHGIEYAGGVLTGLHLENENLTGTIPGELANLSSLQQLVLNDNNLTGEIPEALGNLANLEVLDLGNNNLTGEVPNSIGSLPKAWRISLNHNDLSGSLPSGMANMTAMRQLHWQGNSGGLCAPSDAQFQDSLGSIEGHLGPMCFSLRLDAAISDQLFRLDRTITDLVLPSASGGTTPYTFSLTPALPTGLTFTASTRTLSGTPTVLQTPKDFVYRVEDALGAAATDTFSLQVRTTLEFSNINLSKQTYTQYKQITSLVLPEAIGGRAPLTYYIDRGVSRIKELPAGLNFEASTRTLSGTPTEAQPETWYQYGVVDAVGSVAWRQLKIEVIAGSQLPLSGTIPDQVYFQNQTITDLVLPFPTSGTAPYTYTLSPSPPSGLTWAASSRTLSGTPTEVQSATKYTYTVRDNTGWTGILTFSIEVRPNLALSDTTVVYTRGRQITDLVLDAATGGTSPYTYTLSPSPPSGLTWTASTRTISGTPTTEQGATNYTYQVTDGNGATAQATISIEVRAAPALSDTTVVYTRGRQITDLVLDAATGGTSPYTYTLSPSPPSGLTWTASTRTISGTPTTEQGATNYTYQVTDGNGATAQATISIEVRAAPALSDTTVVYTRNRQITDLVLDAATGGTSPYTYTLSPSPPSGLTWTASTRTISGTPTTEQGATNYTYQVTDGNGATAQATISIEVRAAPALSDTTVVYTRGRQITDLVLDAATGGTSPYTYTLSPSPPSGLTWTASTRTISGTPTTEQGATNYTYQVTDGNGATAQATISIEVRAAPALSDTTVVYTRNRQITDLVLDAATGGTSPYTYTLSPSPPSGLTWTASTRTISGTPTTEQGATNYTYQVTDGNGATAQATISIEVRAAPALSDTTVVYTRGRQITDLVLDAATGGTSPYTYTLSPSPPSGLTWTASTRTISGTPTTEQGATNYTYQVTDGNGATAQATISIEVRAAPALSDTTVVYTRNRQITDLVLDAATGGTSPYTYTLSPSPPSGLTWTASTRTISGTPTTEQGATNYTYQVTDGNGATAQATISIEVRAAPALSDTTVVYTRGRQITDLVLDAATGGTSPYTYTLSPSPPSGLTWTASTRTISGTPAVEQGATNYTYQVTDGNGAMASANVNITVNPALALSGPILAQVYSQNQSINPLVLPQATGGTAPVTYSLTTPLPAGLLFDANTRTLSGTPSVVQGATNYIYQTQDANGATASLLVSIEVRPALTLSGTVAKQVYTQNRSIGSVQLPSAAGGVTPYTYTLTPTLPNGLTFDPNTQTLSGTPLAIQPATNYTYSVQDANGATAAITLSIAVLAPLSLSGTVANQTYTQNLRIIDLILPAAGGGILPYTYTLTPGPPAGLSFDASTRTLSGTPTQLQQATTYTYQVADNAGSSQSLTFTIAVVSADVLVLPPVPDQVYEYGEVVSYAFPNAHGGELPYQYSLVPQALPLGFEYDGSLLELSGTAQEAIAPREYTFRVTDAAQQTKSHTFTLEVLVTLAGVDDQTYLVGQEIEDLVLPTSGGGSDPHKYSLTPDLPDGLVFDPEAHTIGGTPTAGLPKTAFEYTVTDASGLRASMAFNIEVHLAIAQIPNQSYVVGQLISIEVLPEAVGGTDPHVYALAPAPPDGIQFNAVARTLSGTPTEAMSQTRYRYWVVDANGATGQQTFNMTVNVGTLQLPSVDDQDFVVGTEIAPMVLPEAVGGLAPYVYRLSPVPPAGLSFDDASRILSGTPTEASPLKTYQFTVEDAAGDTTSQTFGLQVHAALTIPSVNDQHYAVGISIGSVQLPAAVGGVGPPTYSLSPDPPEGITFDHTTRMLSGTPSAASASRAYTYAAVDTVGSIAEQSFQIAVHGAYSLPTVEDQLYEAGQLIPDLELPAAVGGAAPYSYDLSPVPPSGLAFDAAARTLSGTPTQAMARATYTYAATDAVGLKVQRTFEIEVRLGLAAIADQAYTVGTQIPELQLPQAVGGTGPITYRLTPTLPPGLTFDAAARTLSGTPSAEMAHTMFTYAASDALGLTGARTFHITVSVAALALASVPDQIYAVDEPIAPLTLPPATGGRPPYGYALRPAPPPGLTFDPATRTLSGTPTSVMKQTVYMYEVTDQDAESATQTFTMAVGTSAALLCDRAALMALYEATDGPNWTHSANWLDPPESEVVFTASALDAWHGVTAYDGRVRAVELPENNLQGGLPPELGCLTALERLQLPENGLNGTMPEELAQLHSLEQLHFNDNRLTGEIPESYGQLSQLTELWLHGNRLSGAMPAGLGRLARLTGLLLSGNELTGPIPRELGGLAHLKDLWLQDNDLSGTIPSGLGQLDSLQALLLSDNELTGTIPPALGNLAHLQDLWLQGNSLSGAVPSELDGLDRLRALLLDNNELTGTIPSVLGELSELRWLKLQENDLSGTIPTSLGQLSRLERLELGGNRLTGLLPASLGQLNSLEYLYVHENTLTGELPRSLVNLTALKELFFDGPLQEVCAPVDAEFRTWTALLDAVRGPDCGAPSTVSFEEPILAKIFVRGKGVAHQVLPPATGGQAPYRYTLHPEPPAGLTFNEELRTLAGTPADTVSGAEFAYVAVDERGHKAAARFTITVLPADATLLEVHGNYPNPFRESTSLALSLGRDAEVSLEVFDLLGRRVLEQQGLRMQAGGRQRLAIEGLGRVSGIYLYRVKATAERQTTVQTGRMTLVK